MKKVKTIFNFLFNYRTICGKKRVEKSMSKKYGEYWLEQCIESLRNPNIRVELKETLKL